LEGIAAPARRISLAHHWLMGASVALCQDAARDWGVRVEHRKKRNNRMYAGRIGPGIRIAIVVLALGCGRAFGGFTDAAYAGESQPPLIDQTLVEGEQKLEFSVTSAKTVQTVPQVQTLGARVNSPVTAPLPVAVIPGGVLLAGSFIMTRVFKRQIV
jgi:hypothetical protein